MDMPSRSSSLERTSNMPCDMPRRGTSRRDIKSLDVQPKGYIARVVFLSTFLPKCSTILYATRNTWLGLPRSLRNITLILVLNFSMDQLLTHRSIHSPTLPISKEEPMMQLISSLLLISSLKPYRKEWSHKHWYSFRVCLSFYTLILNGG